MEVNSGGYFPRLDKYPPLFTYPRAANNLSFLKGHMSDQVSILVGQNRNVVARFFLITEVFWNNYVSSLFTYYLLTNLSGHNVRPKLKFRRTWAVFSRTLSDVWQLFAALLPWGIIVLIYTNPMDSQHLIVPFFWEMRKKLTREIRKNAGRWIADTIPNLSSQSERAKNSTH